MSTKILPVKHSCGGEITYYAGAFKCSGCGKEWVTNQEKHALFLELRPELLASAGKIGDYQTSRLYCMGSSTLSGLLKKWRGEPAPAPAAPDPETPAPGLPRFPEFSDKWDKGVQKAWLETYLELAKTK